MQQIKMKIGPKGQVVIPQSFRAKLHLVPGTEITFEEDVNSLVLRRPTQNIEEVAEVIAKAGKSIGRIHPHEAYEDSLKEREGHVH